MDIALAGSSISYRPNDEQLGGLSLQFAAFDGEVGIGQIPVPDPSAAISIYDGRACRVDEGDTRLTDGFIIDQDRERGPMPAGTARLHTFSVQDANALLDGFRVERSRPAETDVARVLAFAALDGPAWDVTFVIDANTVTMPKKSYASDGGWTSELIPDLIEFTGKTLFLHDLADGSGRCLHYHILTDGHDCGLQISDGSTNGPLIWNPWDPRRQRTSVDLRNDVKVRDQAGRTATVTDGTSIGLHDADGLQHQALIDLEAASQADLDVKAAALLASAKDERDTWTCSIGPLDEDALALIRVGDVITVTSSVMGLTASDQRIAHMTLSPVIGEGGRAAEGYWMAALELGAPVRRRARVTNKSTPIGQFPDDEWVCIPTDFGVPGFSGSAPGYAILSNPAWSGVQSNDSLDAGGSGAGTMYGGTTYTFTMLVFHSPGSGWLDSCGIHSRGGVSVGGFSRDMGAEGEPGPSPPPPLVLVTGTFSITDTDTDYVSFISATNDVDHNSYTSEVSVHVNYEAGPDPRFASLGPCSNSPPRIGQRVRQGSFLGDGTTTAFTTDWPYMPNSLLIEVNGLDWTPDVTESDPTTGDFTVAYPFPLDSTVVIRYRRLS